MRKTTNSLFKFQTSSSLKIYDPTGTRKSSSFRRKKQDTKFIFLNIDFPYTFLNVNFIDPASFHRNQPHQAEVGNIEIFLQHV